MKFNKSKSRVDGQKGFTLIEALVVMIVGIVILAAAAAGIGKLFRSSEISTEAENITQMSATLKNLKNGANGYDGLSNKLAVDYKAVPATMTSSVDGDSTKLFNTWNGPVDISPTSGNQAFQISYGLVPSEACQQLALKLRNAGWSSLTADGTEIKSDTGLAAIATACSKEGGTTMVFVSSS